MRSCNESGLRQFSPGVYTIWRTAPHEQAGAASTAAITSKLEKSHARKQDPFFVLFKAQKKVKEKNPTFFLFFVCCFCFYLRQQPTTTPVSFLVPPLSKWPPCWTEQDGPTHQPVETVSGLRVFPNLDVLRPADPEETAAAYAAALDRKDGPTALILTRQNVRTLKEIPVRSRVIRVFLFSREGGGGRGGSTCCGTYFSVFLLFILKYLVFVKGGVSGDTIGRLARGCKCCWCSPL